MTRYMQFNAGILQPNQFTPAIDSNLALYGVGRSETLGVERELQRFAMNDYLRRGDRRVLVGAQDTIVDPDDPNNTYTDDLLLTNAITENTEQDQIDKTRYYKEVREYITVNSAARIQALDVTPKTTEGLPTLLSTGFTPVNTYTFAPFEQLSPNYTANVQARYAVVNQVSSDGSQNMSLGKTQDYTAQMPPTNTIVDFIPFNQGFAQLPGHVIITSEINRINFTLTNIDPLNPDANGPVLNVDSTDLFDFFLPIGSYTVMGLQTAIQTATDLVYPSVFTVTCFTSLFINPGLVNIQIDVDPTKWTYIWDFKVPFNSPQVAGSPVRPDGAIVQFSVAPDGETLSAVANSGALTFFPNPNNYVISFHRALTNVKAIRLVSSEMPNTDTIINLQNNGMSFQLNNAGVPVLMTDGSVDWQFYLDQGNYTVTQLASELQLGLNNLVFGEVGIPNLFTITADTIKGFFTLSTPDPYTFLWTFDDIPELDWRNLWRMLGFNSSSSDDFVSEFDNTITINQGTALQPFETNIPYAAFNLRKSNLIWMYLNGYETIYDTYTQKNYFAKFTLAKTADNEIAYDRFNSAPQIFQEAPLSNLTRLNISFFDELGNPANFNYVDHTLTLEFTTFQDQMMGTHMSSKRGTTDRDPQPPPRYPL
jgi:hypothetical protein